MNYYYCYSIKKGLFDKEMEYAKNLGVYIFYDEKENKFCDQYNNQIDIKNKNIFPRTGAIEAPTLIEAIIKNGGNSLINIDDYQKTLNWPYYIKTIRNNILISGNQIIENPQYIVDIFGKEKIFFKTKFKNFSQIINIEELTDPNSDLIKIIKIHQNDDFIISDVVTISEDQYGPREYRAFVVNGEVINISRVSDYLLECIPNEILNKLNEIVSKLKETDFPLSYVIDIFEYQNKYNQREIDVLECNPIIASGSYLYNTVFEKKDLKHQCPSASIPKEKAQSENSNEYSFNVKNQLTPSIYYNLPGGFAKDLTSFKIFGTQSSEDMYFHFDAPGYNLLSLSSLLGSLITDESELSDDSEESFQKQLKKIKEEI